MLAAVGVFGVMATLVRQRTRELGVRIALGATAGNLGGLVLRRGFAIAMAGLSAGLIGAFLANRLLITLLYEVSPTDGVTLITVAALILLLSTLACVLPVRVDPCSRCEQIRRFRRTSLSTEPYARVARD